MRERRRILLVEDEEELLFGLKDRLETVGFEIASARDGVDALAMADASPFDCIVLDVALPRKDGFQVCRELRQRGDRTPILMLTARSAIRDRVEGLRLGADDYLVKPFSPIELVARIAALLRRIPRPRRGIERYAGERLALDFVSGCAMVRGNSVALSNMEMKLLRYLVERPGTVVSREELLAYVWGHSTTLATRTVDVHIATLRQKLERDPAQPEIIVTVHRSGYKFDGE